MGVTRFFPHRNISVATGTGWVEMEWEKPEYWMGALLPGKTEVLHARQGGAGCLGKEESAR